MKFKFNSYGHSQVKSCLSPFTHYKNLENLKGFPPYNNVKLLKYLLKSEANISLHFLLRCKLFVFKWMFELIFS